MLISIDYGNEAVCFPQAYAASVPMFGKLRERMIDLRSGKAVFVGGGSILLRRQIEACDKVGHALFVDDISANAKGYDLLYRAARKRR